VGIDAWDLLRTEKGYLHVGADTDGTTTPLDVGFGQVLKKKSDFVGRRSLTLPANQRPDRLQLVGFEPRRAGAVLPIGAHIRAPDARGSMGYVTSAAASPTLGRTVALGMLEGGSRRHGEVVTLETSNGPLEVTVTAPGAYDLGGERLNG
jgi:sarcosine oxidase subunit alpha